MAKCDTFTEIPLTEKSQTDHPEENRPKSFRDLCDTILYWIRYWWTWIGAMCC